MIQIRDQTTDFIFERIKYVQARNVSVIHGVFCALVTQTTFLAILITVLDKRGAAIVDIVVFCFLFSVLCFSAVTLPVGLGCGWFSLFWFFHSKISVRAMTVVLVVIAELAFFGWGLVILN